jgi:hypothetical protein
MALYRWFKFLLKWIGTKQTRMDKKVVHGILMFQSHLNQAI